MTSQDGIISIPAQFLISHSAKVAVVHAQAAGKMPSLPKHLTSSVMETQ